MKRMRLTPQMVAPAAGRGDWKLIRIFHVGENGAHRHLIFNLREDPGEKNDLAVQQPERVRELDALIEEFLADTGNNPGKARTPEEHARIRAPGAASRVISREDAVSNLGPAFPESFRLRLDGKPDGLFITRWLQKVPRVNCLPNSAYPPATASLRLEGRPGGRLWVYNPADGSIAAREAAGSLTIEPNSSLFLIE